MLHSYVMDISQLCMWDKSSVEKEDIRVVKVVNEFSCLYFDVQVSKLLSYLMYLPIFGCVLIIFLTDDLCYYQDEGITAQTKTLSCFIDTCSMLQEIASTYVWVMLSLLETWLLLKGFTLSGYTLSLQDFDHSFWMQFINFQGWKNIIVPELYRLSIVRTEQRL